MSLRGYWRTVSERIDCSPAIRITRLTTTARTGRLMNRSVNFMLAVLRLRCWIVGRLNLVLDRDGGAAAQLENTGRHDLLAGLHAVDDCNLVTARVAQLDELLANTLVGLAVRTLDLFHDEDRIAVGRVTDRGGGQRQHRLALAHDHPGLDEHARKQPAVVVQEGRLHVDVARG